MPRIDPQRLLKCLNPLLDANGAIKSDKEVDKIFGLMSKFSKKLVSKCMYLNIMKATPDDVLDLFMQRGGWEMIYTWTTEANTAKNYALLTDIANLLLQTPATTSRLKENELPKIIKSLARESEREETKNVAKQVFTKWMAIAKNEESPGGSRILKSLENSLEEEGGVQQTGVELTNMDIPLDSQVILMETDCPPNEFDINQYIGNTDLNTLVFNPESFNNTVDQHLDDLNSSIKNTKDSTGSSTLTPVGGSGQTEVDSKQIHTQGQTKASEQSVPPFALVSRNGRHYILKVKKPVEKDSTSNAIETQESPKKTSKGRSVVSPGKPSMETYNLKVKTAEAVALEAKAGKGDKTAKKPSKDGSSPSRSSSSSETSAKKPSRSKSKAAEEIKLKQQAEDEKFRRKMAEQKKLLAIRKKEAEKEKLQKEKDEATLKALKLNPTTTGNSRIPKIPKKAPASFTDVIGIPGVKDDSKTETRKVKKRDSMDSSSSSSVVSSSASGEKSNSSSSSSKGKEEEAKPERRHRPKVYNNTKSRSLSLLEDMVTQEKEKDKDKDKDKFDNEDSKGDNDKESDNEKQAGKISSKTSKRASTESMIKPDAKKPKTSDKEKEKSSKDSSKKKDDKESKDGSKKVIGIQESSLFMDAISASLTSKHNKRKRRTSSTGENAKEDAKEKVKSKGKPTSPTEENPPVKQPLLNFYRDTLDDDEGQSESAESKTTGADEAEGSKSSDEEKDAFEPEEGEGVLKSALIIHRLKNRVKKTVRWRPDEEIKSVRFFDLDETERENVFRTKNFMEARLKERSEEGKIVKRKLFGAIDMMEEKTEWKAPVLCMLQENLPYVPINSEEIKVQGERERGILEVFYFTKKEIPDCPDESLIPSNIEFVPPMRVSYCEAGFDTKEKPIEIIEEPEPSLPLPNQTLHMNGFGFNVPPPVFNPANTAPEFNGWNPTLNPFTTPAPEVNLWNAAAAAQAAQAAEMANYQAQNFPNPNMGMMGGIGGIPPPFPTNGQFDYPPFRGGRGGPPPNSNAYESRHAGMGRGHGYSTRDRDTDYRGGRDYQGRDKDRDRDRRDRGDRHDRERDRDYSSRDRRDYPERGSGRNRAGRVPTVPCKFFVAGKCSKGDKCDFLHAMERPNRSARPNPRPLSPPRGVLQQEDWDSPTPAPATTPASPPPSSVENNDVASKTLSHQDSVESNFSAPPSSPDCLPPGTEPPIIIPVAANNE